MHLRCTSRVLQCSSHQARLVSDLAHQLERVARQLAEHCLTVELALVHRGLDSVHDTADTVTDLSTRFRALCRQLLAAGVPPRARDRGTAVRRAGTDPRPASLGPVCPGTARTGVVALMTQRHRASGELI
jgi:hypothetical protein